MIWNPDATPTVGRELPIDGQWSRSLETSNAHLPMKEKVYNRMLDETLTPDSGKINTLLLLCILWARTNF